MQSLSPTRLTADSVRHLIGKWAIGSVAFRRYLPLLYLALCLPTVLFLVFFRQPLSNPDELSHVSRAYQMSNGILLTTEALPGLHPKGMVEENLFRLGDRSKPGVSSP